MCEVAERIYNQGIEQGIARGTEYKAKQMAIQLHKAGVSDELIAVAAAVSIDTVREWIRQESV